jgi:tetratricopeptide (TPR) repeat protein
MRLIRQLGEGGMGVVYEALDEERGARVAVKTMRDLNAESLARFKREFRALADVHHPNVVTLGELFSEGRDWFFTMELVEGEDFLEYVRPTEARWRAVEALPTPSVSSERAIALAPTERFSRSGAEGFDETRLRSALRQIAGALAALHAAGVVHRDIKPSNIRVTPAGRVVLLDFGLATESTKDHSTARTICGTPAYMAPEQADSGDVGPEADWYAVGVLLYEALTGVVPFDGAPLVILRNKLTHTPAPPRTLVADLPADLDALCVALLQYEPKARPTAAHVQRALGATEVGPSPWSLVEQALFVGRAAELDALRSAFHGGRTGDAVSILVEGESGVGKSCLVRRFVATLSAERPDLVVLAGRCYEREAVPYKALDGVVDALAQLLVREGDSLASRILPTRIGPLAQVFPVLRRVNVFADATRRPAVVADPVDLRNRAFAAMRDMLARLAAARPCVVVIDDLQWADADSLALLAEIMRPPDEPPLLFVATIRTAQTDESTATQKMARLRGSIGASLAGRARTIAMARMPEEDARTLTTCLLEREAPGEGHSTEAIVREAGGHPLFIDALVRHSVVVGAGTESVRLEDALWARVAALAPGPRHVMQILAVAGAPVTQEVLAGAVGGDKAELGRHVSLLRVAHLASITGARANDTVEPYHDRVRTAVLANLLGDDRVACHRALAVALEGAPRRETEALVRHWRAAGDTAKAAVYAALAADEAVGALAFDRAAALYAMAIELRPGADAERSGLLEKLGDSLANAGRGARAAEAYAEASRGAHAARSLDLQRRGADQLVRSGHLAEGLAAMGRVLASLDLTLPRSPLSAILIFLVYRVYLRLRGLGFRARDVSLVPAIDLTRIDVCWSLAFALALTDNLRGAAFQARNLLLALRSGERYRIARAVAAEALSASRGGGPALRRTEALLRRAHALAAESGEPHAIGWAHLSSGVANYLAGRPKPALVHLELSRAVLAEVPGSVWELDTITFFSTSCLVQLGEIGRVVRDTPTAVREARQRGDLYAAVNLRIGHANIAWLAVDDAEAALAHIDQAMSEWSKEGFHLEHYYELLARTNALVYSGRGREAYVHVTARWPAFRRSLLPLAIQSVRVFAMHARARSALATAEEGTADRASSLRDAATTARRIERERMDGATPWAKLLRAGIAVAERAGSERAVPLLREAVSGFDSANMALYAAVSRRCLGALLGGDEGRELVGAADAWMTSEMIKSPARMTAMLAPGFGRAG